MEWKILPPKKNIHKKEIVYKFIERAATDISIRNSDI